MSAQPSKKMAKNSEFQEIDHCGGEMTITVKTDTDGIRKYSMGFRHSSPKPASFFAIYALPQGIPAETIQMGGIGTPWNPPPVPDCFPVFIGSDSQSFFGHLCHSCGGYWRSRSAPSRWFSTCPYCGIKEKTHNFLTEGQIHYVEACCALYNKALSSPEDGEHSINMDEVADAVSKGAEKPKFYYAEETQQNKYKCNACGDINDILGKYGFCSCCGTRNDLQEFETNIIPAIRDRINNAGPYEGCVRDAVSAFDSFTGKYIEYLVKKIPMTPRRIERFQKMRFHNLEKVSAEIREAFDINVLRNLDASEIEFSKLMFHRRHIYEHKGGEADQKYIDDSGDTSVRPKQTIRENKKSAHDIANLVLKMAKNLHEDFHSIFPAEKMAVPYNKREI